MKKVPFENGTKVADGYVEIDGARHNTIEPQYIGETPLSAENLNQMQDNIEEAINEQVEHRYIKKITEVISVGGIVEMPCYYKPDTNCLDVYLNGQRLLKSSDVVGTDGHYLEVEIPQSEISNQIMLTSDWGIDADSIEEGRIFEFIVRGEYK